MYLVVVDIVDEVGYLNVIIEGKIDLDSLVNLFFENIEVGRVVDG